MNKILAKLEKLFLASIQKCLGKQKKAAVVYSGGIDSSLVSLTAFNQKAKITTFTIGFPQSHDYQFVKSIRKTLPFPSLLKKLSLAQISQYLPTVKKLLLKAKIEPNLMQISLAAGLFLALKEIKKRGFRLVLSGQGADELFAGYFHALNIPLNQINRRCQEEFQRLKNTDFKREKAIADYFSVKMRYPFCDPELVNFALKIPAFWKLKKEKGDFGRKFILRKLGQEIGLPEAIINRPKKAFQYSCGIQKAIEKILKNNSLLLSES